MHPFCPAYNRLKLRKFIVSSTCFYIYTFPKCTFCPYWILIINILIFNFYLKSFLYCSIKRTETVQPFSFCPNIKKKLCSNIFYLATSKCSLHLNSCETRQKDGKKSKTSFFWSENTLSV